jgi:NAD-dependent SIR2 family protein deacetylase
MVYSGFRFAEAAAAAGKPIAAVNLGRTRADHLIELKIVANCDQVMSALAGEEDRT